MLCLKDRWSLLLFLFISMILAISFFGYHYPSTKIFSISIVTGSTAIKPSQTSNILLIYVYANVYEFSFGNLKYFIENAVREDDGVDYVFILQQVGDRPIDESKMPQLPKRNARYIQHENKCFDYGTIGWFFQRYTIGHPWKNSTLSAIDLDYDLRKYRYFIFMNSSIRGPFFPPYFLQLLNNPSIDLQIKIRWYDIFIQRLNSKVKLVGCTISCKPIVHVQSYLLVTDFIGLAVLLKEKDDQGVSMKGVFECQASKSATIAHSELAISQRILNAGFAIDSLMTKYHTIDFSRQRRYQCKSARNPFFDKNVDGVSLEPYEVVFIKYTGKHKMSESQTKAALYERWMDEIKRENRSLVLSNR